MTSRMHVMPTRTLEQMMQEARSAESASGGEPSLAELRDAIEKVDTTIITAIAERMALSRAVGRVKTATGQPVMDPAREAAVVARAAALAREAGLPEDEVRELYWRIIAASRRAQLTT